MWEGILIVILLAELQSTIIFTGQPPVREQRRIDEHQRTRSTSGALPTLQNRNTSTYYHYQYTALRYIETLELLFESRSVLIFTCSDERGWGAKDHRDAEVTSDVEG